MFFHTFCRGVFVYPQPSGNMYRNTFLYETEIRHILPAPCYYIVPHAFVGQRSLPRFVDEVCDHSEVDDFTAVVLIGADCADVPLKLDSVNVFHDFNVLVRGKVKDNIASFYPV